MMAILIIAIFALVVFVVAAIAFIVVVAQAISEDRRCNDMDSELDNSEYEYGHAVSNESSDE